jgi:hypothetical protein
MTSGKEARASVHELRKKLREAAESGQLQLHRAPLRLHRPRIATMSEESGKSYAGGCLCGALRYAADGAPLYAGYCYCADCRKASGSGYIPFMGFARAAVRFSGQTRTFTSKSAMGTDAVRNFCPVCGSLVFGGELGKSDEFTIYAGSLDDPSSFRPTVAIFTRNSPIWAVIPPSLRVFETTPA